MKVFISAAEISSDQHAAIVARAISQLYSGSHPPVQFFGIGGPALRALPNFRCIENAENLRTMGISEVLRKYRYFKWVMRQALTEIATEQPDLILTLDYPDFHLRLLRQVHERGLAPKSLKICGIPPKVWVWRSRRVEQIRRYYDGTWVIFPFEKTYYQARGIPVIEEGNPLLWQMLQQKPEPIVDDDAELIAVMPGSRDSEWTHLLPIIPASLELLAERIRKPIRALIPIPTGLSAEPIQRVLLPTARVRYDFIPGGTMQALSSAKVGLIKSGTSTLEAAILGCIPVIFYRMNSLSEKFFEYLVRYRGPVGLPNILLGIRERSRSVFPEFLGREATPKGLANALYKILTDPHSIEITHRAIQQVRDQMHMDGNVPQKIAGQILRWMQVRPDRIEPLPSYFGYRLVSLIWSTINGVRRWIYRVGVLKAHTFPVPSILIGNLQAGGAGKTPLLIEIAREARARGLRVAVVSRGYSARAGGKIKIAVPGELNLLPDDFGDEPLEIKSAVPDIYLGVGGDRVAVVAGLLKRSKERGEKIQLLLFDDGFQNLSFKPSMSILLKTVLSRSQTAYRDFDSQARYADFVFENPGRELEWEADFLPPGPIWIVCGIANPTRIKNFYVSRGVQVQRLVAFPDHHPFTESEVKKLILEAKSQDIKIFITEKDAVKWKRFDLGDSVGVLKIRLKNRAWMNEVFDRIACIPLNY